MKLPVLQHRGRGRVVGLGSALLMLAGACEPTEEMTLRASGQVSGSIVSDLPGDAWVFLFEPGKGPPADASAPRSVSAVSALRRSSGDAHFVIAEVPANPYRLWGFLDTNRNFRSDIDVLAQPGAGDRVAEGVTVNVQPAREVRVDLPMPTLIQNEPPAFEVVDVTTDLPLDAAQGSVTTFQIHSARIEGFDPKKTHFTLSLVDANRDGRPDDVNGDNVPDVSLTALLVFKPKPGQLAPGSTLVVPLVFDVTPFLAALNGSLTTSVTTDALTLVVVPQAQELAVSADGGTELRQFGLPPAGSYDLVLTSTAGQFWGVPNQLGPTVPSQGVLFHFDRRR